MYETEVSTEIAAPVEVVYRYLADFPQHTQWSTGVAEIKPVTRGAVGVGSEFQAVEKVPGKFTSFSRITALEPNRRIAWEAWAPGVMKAQWAFELTPAGAGTRLAQRSCFQPAGLMGTVMLQLLRKGRIPQENAASLERIKAILERSPVQA